MKKSFTQLAVFVFITAVLVGCFGGNYKKAEFNRDINEVIVDLKKINDFEDANIKWTVSQFGDNVSHNLKVILKNGKDLPKEDSLLNEIGKDAMRLVVESIDNDTAYTDFIVYFLTENKKGMMNMRMEKPFTYELDELKK